MRDLHTSLYLRPQSCVRLLGLVTALLVIIHIIGQCLRYLLGHGNLYGLYTLFHLDAENSVPTFFSALLLLIAALLLAVIAKVKKRTLDPYAPHWMILAIGFVYLSVDEAARIHELLGRPTRQLLGDHVSETIGSVWIVPGSLLVLTVAVSYLRFIMHLPMRLRVAVLIAGALYVGGAVGVEAVQGFYVRFYEEGLLYSMIITLEEGLEMTGICLFIRVLLTYLMTHVGNVQLCIGTPQSALPMSRERAL